MANPSIRKTNLRKTDGADPVEPVEPVQVNDARMPKERIEPDQMKEWAKRLNVSTTRLREVVQRAGPVVDDVKRFLAHH